MSFLNAIFPLVTNQGTPRFIAGCPYLNDIAALLIAEENHVRFFTEPHFTLFSVLPGFDIIKLKNPCFPAFFPLKVRNIIPARPVSIL